MDSKNRTLRSTLHAGITLFHYAHFHQHGRHLLLGRSVEDQRSRQRRNALCSYVGRVYWSRTFISCPLPALGLYSRWEASVDRSLAAFPRPSFAVSDLPSFNVLMDENFQSSSWRGSWVSSKLQNCLMRAASCSWNVSWSAVSLPDTCEKPRLPGPTLYLASREPEVDHYTNRITYADFNG